MIAVTLDHIDQLTPSIKTFWFSHEQNIEYIAGQFVDLHIRDLDTNSTLRHWFTLSSSPSESKLAITTRFSGQPSAYKHCLSNLTAGDKVYISEPMGDFVLPISPTTPILFVAAGLGITPVRSIATWLRDNLQSRGITVLYAAHDDEFIFKNTLQEAGMNVIEYVQTRHKQTLSADVIQDHYKSGLIYISGPEITTERLVHELTQKGINENDLVTDYFPGYSDF